MELFIGIGVISLVVGLLFLIAPGLLKDANDATSRFIASFEEGLFEKRVGVGLSLVIASLLFFFVAYYINLRG